MEKIEGVPEGYRLVAIRRPKKGEEYFVFDGSFYKADRDMECYAPIIEKIGPAFRPFKNSDEFKPFRDKWIVDKFADAYRVVGFDRNCVWICRFEPDEIQIFSWEELALDWTFEDGTPCGLVDDVESKEQS
jgi:hypothetical protein